MIRQKKDPPKISGDLFITRLMNRLNKFNAVLFPKPLDRVCV